MGVIILNNKSSRDYGIIVEIEPDYEVAERAYDVIPVPGRGDVLVDLKYYKNVERSYKVAVVNQDNGKFTKLAPYIAEWVNSGIGYVRLEDSYHPDQFVRARISNSINVANILSQVGRVELIFDREPKRWLKSGEEWNTIQLYPTTTSILNPTTNTSNPLVDVRCGGDASIWINGKEVKIEGYVGDVVIDLNTMNAYNSTTPNLNKHISIPNGQPELIPGVNTISVTNTISRAKMVPRWWVL